MNFVPALYPKATHDIAKSHSIYTGTLRHLTQ